MLPLKHTVIPYPWPPDSLFMTFPEPHTNNNYLLDHIVLLQSSYRKLTGKELGNLQLSGKDLAKAIFEIGRAHV